MKNLTLFIAIPNDGGNLSNEFIALGRELEGRGHHVHFLVPQHKAIKREQRAFNILPWPSTRPTQIRDFVFMFKMILKYRPTCVIANFAAIHIVTIVSWLLRVPVRIVWQNTLLSHIFIDHRPTWYTHFKIWRMRMVLQLATHVVCGSNALRSDALSIYKVPEQKLTTFYYSVADPIQEFSIQLGVKDKNKIICVGRLDPSKNQDLVLRSLAILKNRRREIHAVFVGEGPMRDTYLQLAKELNVEKSCRFVSGLTFKQLYTEVASSFVAIVPSKLEAFGLTNIEALAVGTPVIASKMGGIPEVIQNGKTGYLISPDSPEELAEKIEALMDQPEVHHKLSQQARQTFLERFEMNRVIQAKANWLEAVLPNLPA